MSKVVYAHIYKQRLLYEARIEIKKTLRDDHSVRENT